jgi:hypothetical protein
LADAKSSTETEPKLNRHFVSARAATETNANVESEMQIATQHQSEPTNPFCVALAKLFSAFAI